MFWVSVVVKSVEKPEVHGPVTSEDGAVSQTTSHRSACQLFSLLGLCFLFVISSSPFYHISWPMSFIPQSSDEARAASLSKSIQQKRVLQPWQTLPRFSLNPQCTLYNRDPPPPHFTFMMSKIIPALHRVSL